LLAPDALRNGNIRWLADSDSIRPNGNSISANGFPDTPDSVSDPADRDTTGADGISDASDYDPAGDHNDRPAKHKSKYHAVRSYGE